MLAIAFVAILHERFISFFSLPSFFLPAIHKRYQLIVNFNSFIDKIQKVLYPDNTLAAGGVHRERKYCGK